MSSFQGRHTSARASELRASERPLIMKRILQEALRDPQTWSGFFHGQALFEQRSEIETSGPFPSADGTCGKLLTLMDGVRARRFGRAVHAPLHVLDAQVVSSRPMFLWIWSEEDNGSFQWAGEDANPSVVGGSLPAPVRRLPIMSGQTTVNIYLSFKLGVINFGLSSAIDTFIPVSIDEQVILSFRFTSLL